MSSSTWIFGLLILLFGPACGEGPSAPAGPSQGSCGENRAVIQVLDGFFQILCGCNEASGTQATGSSALTCTVDAGTTVTFDYTASKTPHQIRSTGDPSFTSSPPVSTQENIAQPQIHAVTFSTRGTYNFDDLYQPSITGRIVVQ